MKKIDVAVVGLGVGYWHLQTYLKSRFINKIFICDLNKNLEKKILQTSKKIFISSFNEILRNKKIKIISIASYDNYHFNQITRSLHNRKNVFVEKPMCMSKTELKKISIKQKKTNLFLSCNLGLRTNPLFLDIKKKINKKFFGKIFHIEGDYLWGRVNKFYGWRSKLEYYSKIYGAAVHIVDLITWLIGDYPKFVFAEGNKIGTNNKLKFNSFVILNLIFKKNLIVKITGNGPCAHPHFHGLKIFGTSKTFTHDYNLTRFFSNKKINTLTLKESLYPARENRKKVLDSFIKGVVNKKTKFFLVDTKSVYNVMDICFAAEESMITKKRIRIKYSQ